MSDPNEFRRVFQELERIYEEQKDRPVYAHEVLISPEDLAIWKTAPTRDEAQHAHVDKAPPDACWLCWKSLGTTEDCVMCAAKRQEDTK